MIVLKILFVESGFTIMQSRINIIVLLLIRINLVLILASANHWIPLHILGTVPKIATFGTQFILQLGRLAVESPCFGQHIGCRRVVVELEAAVVDLDEVVIFTGFDCLTGLA